MSAPAIANRPATRRYRLTEGFAIHPDPANPAVDKIYEPQSIIESPTDLTFMNVPGFRPKYELLPESGAILPQGSFAFDPSKETIEQFAERMKALTIQPGAPAATPVPSTTVNLESMTEEQLRSHAEEEEIPLGNAKSKQQLLAVIKAARKS